MKKVFIFLGVIFLVLVVLRLSIWAPQRELKPLRRTTERVVVKTIQLKPQSLELSFNYVGNLKGQDEAFVYSKVSGKLVRYTVNEGDRVDKAEVIALVDRDETGLKYELAPVESPLAGIVARLFLDRGVNVFAQNIAGANPLALIVDMEKMCIRLNIPEPDIPYIKRGLKAKVRLDAYPETIFEGEVFRVGEALDVLSRTLPVEVSIPNPEYKLKSGMFARVTLIVAEYPKVLAVPQDALIPEEEGFYVFVVEKDLAKKRKVVLGVQTDNLVEIKDGLHENEEVIVFGQHGLKNGAFVIKER